MTQLNVLMELLAYIAILSVTVERLVEMFKPAIDGYVNRTHMGERGRRTTLYLTSFFSGGALHYLSSGTVPYFADPIGSAVVAGLLVSGGSGVWHDLLGVLKDFNTKKAEVTK